MQIRNFVKSIIPNFMLDKFRYYRTKFNLNKKYKGQSAKETFTDIYLTNSWGKSKDSTQPFCSGSGSHDNSYVSTYVTSIENFLEKFPNKQNVVDLGCGDFNIGSKIRPYCASYIACDIVPEVIEHNKIKYQNLNVHFKVLDLSVDDLPTADIVFIRQVLQHLSNSDIQKLIPKLSKSYKYLILTEHLPSDQNYVYNIDIITGSDTRLNLNSGVELTSAPFNMKFLEERVLCEIMVQGGGLLRTKLYRLN